MQTILLSLLSLLGFVTSLNYPVFGTKRYARSNLLPPSDYGSSLSVPVYSPVPQYYDSLPQYMPMSSYSSDYYDDNGYYNGNYYYVPLVNYVHRRHQRQERYPSYGLPTYRGEYKPTPYYYAHAPSYSYSDDRDSNNPLDDLHEEMLQEDERERARDYMPVGQEQWYANPSRHATDSTFLRDLIMYNNQMSSLRGKQPESNEEYEEYEEVEPEYYDTSYSDSRNNYNNYYNQQQNVNSPSRQPLNKISNLRNNMAKNAVEDDEEVQELKSLIHQQKSSRLLQQEPQHQQLQQQQQLYQNTQPKPIPTPAPFTDIKEQQQRSVSNDFNHYGGSDTWQSDSPDYNNYDTTDYDTEYDDNWSHWDRKRSIEAKKLLRSLVSSATTTARSTITSTPSPSATTTTEKPKLKGVLVAGEHNGQKEVVLPRPASPVRNLGLQKGVVTASSTGTLNTASHGNEVRGNVYDTIKKIIDMQQDLEGNELTKQLDDQKHQGSRLQKRIVSNEESLVQQLDGLKRTA